MLRFRPRSFPHGWSGLARAPGSHALALGALLLAGVLGCSREPSKEQYGRGELVGSVRLAPGARMPEYARADVQRAPLHANLAHAPAQCAEANERARRPVQRSDEGLLSGIVVAASDFSHAAVARTPKPVRHRVVIRNCQLEPAVIAARGGDMLELENQDDFEFAPLFEPALRAEPLAKGKRVRIGLVGGRVDALLCPPAAPCGRSDVIVFHHPVFAVTDAAGHFRFPRFPDSELVRVTAWHPLFEPSESFTWVEAGQSASLELLLKPKARFVPASH
ncbi:MAG TPA: hypothetical protein VK509_21225 [Polyangiales bacterium]|nr:hypothetical protein [Polyangiales bacterium]